MGIVIYVVISKGKIVLYTKVPLPKPFKDLDAFNANVYTDPAYTSTN